MPDAEIDSSGGASGSILQLKVPVIDVGPLADDCGFRREAGRHSDQRPATVPI